MIDSETAKSEYKTAMLTTLRDELKRYLDLTSLTANKASTMPENVCEVLAQTDVYTRIAEAIAHQIVAVERLQ